MLTFSGYNHIHAFNMFLHVGVGGRVGAKGATLSQYVAQQIARRKPDPLDKDPRTAILRHAQAAKDNPYWIAPAYAKWVIYQIVTYRVAVTL